MSAPDPSNPQVQGSYADPTATLVAASALDFLLIELVPLAYRIAADLAAREEAWMHGNGHVYNSTSASASASASDEGDGVGDEGDEGGDGTGKTATAPVPAAAAADVRPSTASGTAPPTTTLLDEEEAREAVHHRLESLGYRVGLGVVERYSRTLPRPDSPLSTIKLLCKDLWQLLFRKQIDNLKTNHRGIYVLSDNSFRPLSRMGFDTLGHLHQHQHRNHQQHHAARRTETGAAAAGPGAGAGQSGSAAAGALDAASASAGAGGPGPGLGLGNAGSDLARAQPFLFFPAGVVRGCLSGLGLEATVTAETSGPPAATFQIRTVGAKA